ncbi:hypothetical protein [Zymobacter palmae]|uniref:hypothetical protein n=1 Tax=Zymobacter palmae TaxID=33074 RepID=UPI00048130B3|nr:hypothetical protein [Zymobacter palmae]
MTMLNAPDDVVDKILLVINSVVESKDAEGNKNVSISYIKRRMSDVSPEIIDDCILYMGSDPVFYIGRIREGNNVWLKESGEKRICLLQGGDPRSL